MKKNTIDDTNFIVQDFFDTLEELITDRVYDYDGEVERLDEHISEIYEAILYTINSVDFPTKIKEILEDTKNRFINDVW